MRHDEDFERLLATLNACGEVDDLDDAEEARAREAFTQIFGRMFDGRTSLVGSGRAADRYGRERPASILVLSQHERRFTPHDATSPLHFALICALRPSEAPPSLGRVHALEPVIVADDFSWAMVHTHEDEAMGGPYFVRAENVSADNPTEHVPKDGHARMHRRR